MRVRAVAAIAVVALMLMVSPASGLLDAKRPKAPAAVPTNVACAQTACAGDRYQAVVMGSSLYVVRRSDGAVLRVDAKGSKAQRVGAIGAPPPCAPTDTTCPASPFVGLATLANKVWVLAPVRDGTARLTSVGGTGRASGIPVPGRSFTPPSLTAAGGRLWTVKASSPSAGSSGYVYSGELMSASPGSAFASDGTAANGPLEGAGSLIACACQGFFFGGGGSVFFDALLVVDAHSGKVAFEDRGSGIAAAAGVSGALINVSSIASNGAAVYGVASFLSGIDRVNVLFRLDARTHAITAVRVPTTSIPQQLAAADGRLWAVVDAKVARVDPTTLATIGCLPSISSTPGARSPFLAAGGGLVWSIDQSGRVLRVPASTPTQSCTAVVASGPKPPGLLRARDLAGVFRQITKPFTSSTTAADLQAGVLDRTACTQSVGAVANALGSVSVSFAPPGANQSLSEEVTSFPDAQSAKAEFAKRSQDEVARLKCGKVAFLSAGSTTPTEISTFTRVKVNTIGGGVFAAEAKATGVSATVLTFVSGAYVVSLIFPGGANALSVKDITAIAGRALHRLGATA